MVRLSLNDRKNKNRGAHGDSSSKLSGLPLSIENPPALAVGSVNILFLSFSDFLSCAAHSWTKTIEAVNREEPRLLWQCSPQHRSRLGEAGKSAPYSTISVGGRIKFLLQKYFI